MIEVPPTVPGRGCVSSPTICGAWPAASVWSWACDVAKDGSRRPSAGGGGGGTGAAGRTPPVHDAGGPAGGGGATAGDGAAGRTPRSPPVAAGTGAAGRTPPVPVDASVVGGASVAAGAAGRTPPAAVAGSTSTSIGVGDGCSAAHAVAWPSKPMGEAAGPVLGTSRRGVNSGGGTSTCVSLPLTVISTCPGVKRTLRPISAAAFAWRSRDSCWKVAINCGGGGFPTRATVCGGAC